MNDDVDISLCPNCAAGAHEHCQGANYLPPAGCDCPNRNHQWMEPRICVHACLQGDHLYAAHDPRDTAVHDRIEDEIVFRRGQCVECCWSLGAPRTAMKEK